MNQIYKIINKVLKESLNICDVGAAGGIHDRWKKIHNLFIVGFEPDTREYKNLTNSNSQKWFNIGLNHTKGVYPLYITKYQTNTSLYKPNLVFINELCYAKDDFKIEKEIKVNCDSLDNILYNNQIKLDYIKIDTQGSELDILKGGTSALETDIFAIEVEVEFNELYQSQPMFADVDIFLRKKGYILMDIGNMLHVKGKHTVGIGGQKSFLISGDALYFKSLDHTVEIIKKYGINKLYKIIAICLVYGYNDFALEICYRLEKEKIVSYDELITLKNDLKKIHMPSYYIPEFKYKPYIRKLFSIFADFFTKTKNAAWINDIGNIRD